MTEPGRSEMGKTSPECESRAKEEEKRVVHERFSVGWWQENLEYVLENRIFHIVVIVFVIVDVIIVLFHLLIDHDIVVVEPDEKKHNITHILHTASLTILSFMLAEVILKVVVFRLGLLKKYLELFDGFVVIISFILDLITFEVVQLLLIARLWRVARVINGVILVAKEEREIHQLSDELSEKFLLENSKLKVRVNELLSGHDVKNQESPDVDTLLVLDENTRDT